MRVGTEKEGNGISSFLFLAGFVADAMDGCGEEGVGLVFEVLNGEEGGGGGGLACCGRGHRGVERLRLRFDWERRQKRRKKKVRKKKNEKKNSPAQH